MHHCANGLAFDFLLSGASGIFKTRGDSGLNGLHGNFIVRYILAEYVFGTHSYWIPCDIERAAQLYHHIYDLPGTDTSPSDSSKHLTPDLPFAPNSDSHTDVGMYPGTASPFYTALTSPYTHPSFVSSDVNLLSEPHMPFSVLEQPPILQPRNGQRVVRSKHPSNLTRDPQYSQLVRHCAKNGAFEILYADLCNKSIIDHIPRVCTTPDQDPPSPPTPASRTLEHFLEQESSMNDTPPSTRNSTPSTLDMSKPVPPLTEEYLEEFNH